MRCGGGCAHLGAGACSVKLCARNARAVWADGKPIALLNISKLPSIVVGAPAGTAAAGRREGHEGTLPRLSQVRRSPGTGVLPPGPGTGMRAAPPPGREPELTLSCLSRREIGMLVMLAGAPAARSTGPLSERRSSVRTAHERTNRNSRQGNTTNT
jgi:hypothetical protein